MNRPLTLPELAALQGDKSPLPPQKTLSEAAYAELVEAMRLLNAASRRLDAAAGALQACRVSFDVGPFRRLQNDLNAAYAALQPAMLAHIDALDRINNREGKTGMPAGPRAQTTPAAVQRGRAP